MVLAELKKRISNEKIIDSLIKILNMHVSIFSKYEAKIDWLKGEIGKFAKIYGNINIVLSVIESTDL